ncbi:hypothetical protein ACO0OL_003181 [Hanseniaspora opuntiae]
MLELIDSINYRDLPHDICNSVLMPTINTNIQSILCFSSDLSISVVNFDMDSSQFLSDATITSELTVKEHLDLNNIETGSLKNVSLINKNDIDNVSYTSTFFMTFERCAIILTVDTQHENGIIKAASLKLKNVFTLENSATIIDFYIADKAIWLIATQQEQYLLAQDVSKSDFDESIQIDTLENFGTSFESQTLSSILHVGISSKNHLSIVFGSKDGCMHVFTCNGKNELQLLKTHDLSQYSVNYSTFTHEHDSNYLQLVNLTDPNNKDSVIGVLSKNANKDSFIYTELGGHMLDMRIGPTLNFDGSAIPSFALITSENKLRLFVKHKEVDVKKSDFIECNNLIWSADKTVLFFMTPRNAIFSLNMRKSLTAYDIIDGSYYNASTFCSETINFVTKNIINVKPRKSIGKGSIDDPISLDDIESPIKIERATQQKAKRNTPLSGQKSMTDFFEKKILPSPNKPESIIKQLRFDEEPLQSTNLSMGESLEKIFEEKMHDAFTEFEKSMGFKPKKPSEEAKKTEYQDKDETKLNEKLGNIDKISLPNLITSENFVDNNSKEVNTEGTKEGVLDKEPDVHVSEDLPASDSIAMKFHAPTLLVPKSLKRIIPTTDDSGLEKPPKKAKKELEGIEMLDDYTLSPMLAFAKVRLSIPKLRTAFQVSIENEYTINVMNKSPNDQNPTRVFLKPTSDKNDDTHPSETQFLQKCVSLVTGTTSFFAFSTENGVIYICSSLTGRRLEQPLMLGVPVSMLESAGNYLVCLTCVGELYCWNVDKMELAHPVASIYPVLSPCLRSGNDVLSRAENITSISVTKNGVSLITLSNGDSYLYDKMMQSWSLINDSWWAYSSKHWDASNNKGGLLASNSTKKQNSIMKMLEYKTNEELKRKGQAKFIQNFTKTMLFKEGFENLEQSASISHLFNKLYVYKKFEEFEEFQDTLIVLCSTLAEFGLTFMLQEVFDVLFDIETENFIGPYKKHDLLRKSIAAVYQVGTAESKRAAKMYSDNL